MHEWTLPIRNPVFLLSVLLLVVLIVPTLMQRLRIPGLVGLILAGAFLGPHGINLLEQGEGIQLLAKAGLLYIMFWAGLEIDLNTFLKNKHKSLVFGLLTFGLPLMLGGAGAYYLLGFTFTGALLAASMFSTHTLISYPIINRFRLTQNEAVVIAVGGTMITDTLALLILAVISGMQQGEVNTWFWFKMISSLFAFGLVIYFLLPRAAKWFFRRVESDLTYQYVFVLALLFSCGVLAELAGVEAIIGAFFAGLMLNRLVPDASPLMNRIELFGNALFIPAFMFSVGMLINPAVFFEGQKTIVTALVLTSIALITKWVAAFATQKIFRYTGHQRQLIFGLTSSHAAATIAIILIGFQLKIFDETVLNAIIFLILITCLVSTFSTDRVTRKMVAGGEVAFPASAAKEQRILVPYANPKSVIHLVDFSFLIKLPNQQEPVYPLAIFLEETDVREKIRHNIHLLEPVLAHAAEHKVLLSPVHRVDVSPASGIVRTANELLATDIVIGWQPRVSTTEKLFGTLHDNLLEDTTDIVFVTHFTRSPIVFRKVEMVIPFNGHLEPGFGGMVSRIENMCLYLNAALHLHCAPDTGMVFKSQVSKKLADQLQISVLEEEDIFRLHQNAADDVFYIFVSARWEGLSYKNYLEKWPAYLAAYFREKSFVLIFPGL